VGAVALVFFEGRLILGVTGLETANGGLVEAVIWSCLALALPLADVVNTGMNCGWPRGHPPR